VTDLVLPERVTLAEATAAARDLTAKVAAPNGAAAPLVIDASGVKAFDSSAFAVMLEVARRGTGRGVRITGAPASMVALAKLYGVDELLDFAEA
jgi:phospholipid transport system transporter-binding protein